MTRKKRYRKPNFMNGVFLVLFIVWVAYRISEIQQTQAPNNSSQQEVRVLRVIDGDTLLIEGNQRVRLLGVDTPETKHPTLPPQPFGEEASAFTKTLTEGKTVLLVFDKERFDDYQRILAFVFLGERFLNEELVLAGLATAEPQYPFRSDFKRRLINAEKFAQENRIGIWSLTK